MTCKHTTGPWTAYELGDEDGTWKEWSIVANGPLAYGGDNGNGVENSRANAHLMAAAPELLAALEQMRDDWLTAFDNDIQEGNEDAVKILADADAAIAKARGANPR